MSLAGMNEDGVWRFSFHDEEWHRESDAAWPTSFLRPKASGIACASREGRLWSFGGNAGTDSLVFELPDQEREARVQSKKAFNAHLLVTEAPSAQSSRRSPPLGRTWELVVDLADSPAPPLAGAAMAALPNNAGVVVFGGQVQLSTYKRPRTNGHVFICEVGKYKAPDKTHSFVAEAGKTLLRDAISSTSILQKQNTVKDTIEQDGARTAKFAIIAKRMEHRTVALARAELLSQPQEYDGGVDGANGVDGGGISEWDDGQKSMAEMVFDNYRRKSLASLAASDESLSDDDGDWK
jgi:hypothetical protein